jgi:hypothetical protein
LLTDAPDDVANQVCNTFASDWSDDDAKSSDGWKHTGSANAVSPDNMTFWDSPAAGNQGQFKSVYGSVEEAFYRPGTYTRVPIYRWKHVETRGMLTGTVVANADVKGANVSLLGSGMQDVVVNSDGRFRFDNVAVGNYTVSAGLNINGYFNTAEVTVQINAGTTTNVAVPLQPPPEIYRLITIWVENRLTGVRRLRTARAILPRPRRSKCSHSTHTHTSTSMVHPTSRRGPTSVST